MTIAMLFEVPHGCRLPDIQLVHTVYAKTLLLPIYLEISVGLSV